MLLQEVDKRDPVHKSYPRELTVFGGCTAGFFKGGSCKERTLRVFRNGLAKFQYVLSWNACGDVESLSLNK